MTSYPSQNIKHCPVKDIRILAFIIVGIISNQLLFSQNVDTEKYSAGTLKKIGISADRSNDPYLAIDFYEKYLEKAKVDAKINYRLAENYRKARNYKKALENYEIAYNTEPKKYTLSLYYQAQMQQALGNYQEALQLYDNFSSEYRGKSDSYEYRRLSKFAMEGCQLALADSLNSNVVVSHLNESINKAHIESSPIVLENKLLFTSLPMSGLETYPASSDSFPRRKFYLAEEKDMQWKNSGLWEEIDFPEGKDISSGSISLDGNRFYFSACNTDSKNKTICEIWKSEKHGENWSKAEKLSESINQSNYTATQPAVGKDYKGREVLYFVSDRKGGKGGMDIWYSRYNDRVNEFTSARNAGSKINSIGDELSPFINPQNQNLYFSSNGHPGYGGLDIFKSVGERSKWLDPENIGKPFNSSHDELYYTLDSEGERGFFASNREKSVPLKNEHCCDDLFQFKHSDFVKIMFKGQVVDEEGKSVQDANMRLYMLPRMKEREEDDIAEEIFIKELNTDTDGKFEFRLESGYNYVIKTKKDDYLLDEAPFSTLGQKISIDVLHKVSLKKLPYEAMVLNKIYYENNQSALTDTAKATIDNSLFKIMSQNPEIVAEISSHTDSKGTEAYNKHLSQKRAESVVNYLRSKGIDKSRMIAVGYGESKPIAKNLNEDGTDNPEGQAINRRTEFKVIEKLELKEEDDLDED